MLFNEVIEYEITTDLTSEPVSVAELKRHLNLLFDTTGSFEFTDDDTYLGTVIAASRKYMENYTGLSFGLKTIVAILRNELGDVELPFGPVISITSVKNEDGAILTLDTEYTLSGRKFKRIALPCLDYLEVTYAAGYTTLPADLKQAVIIEAGYRYINRSGEQYCKASLELAAPYKRSSWLV